MTMRFIKVTTNLTKPEIDSILASTSTDDKTTIANLYDSFSHVELIEVDKTVSMFAVIHQNIITDVFELYVKMGINFKYEDITERVLFSCLEANSYPEVSKKLSKLINEYISNYLTVDNVLDKISEMGRDSLNEVDMKVLSKA